MAETLERWGREIIFVCRDGAGNLNTDVESAGFKLIELPRASPVSTSVHTPWLNVPEEYDARETLAALETFAPLDCLVIDHYGLSATWERVLRPLTRRIAVIDDLADRQHDCDVLVDVTPCFTDARTYEGLVSPNCLRLLGASYAILRPQFARLRGQQSRRGDHINRLLISFGASDPNNHSQTAVESVRAALGDEVHIDIILGRSAPHLEALKRRYSDDRRVSFHIDTADVAQLMAAADLAIGAGGTMGWERACLGLPALIAVIADNQRASAASLEAAGCALVVSSDSRMSAEIVSSLAWLRSRPSLLRLMGTAGHNLIDGRGAVRVARSLSPSSIVLRRARPEDSRQVWAWRNDQRVRQASTNPRAIEWEAHQEWYARYLADKGAALLIGEESGRPVGVLRFDIGPENAVISVYLTPHSHGRGLGVDLVRAGEVWLKEHYDGVQRIVADIMPHNRASVAAFEAADYRPRLLQYERDLSDE